jgi:hypothetical protein
MKVKEHDMNLIDESLINLINIDGPPFTAPAYIHTSALSDGASTPLPALSTVMDYTSDGTSSGDNSRQKAMSEDLESAEAPKKKAKKTKKATGRYKVEKL